MIAKDLMTVNPVAVRERTLLRDAVDLLHRLDVRHLPVVNAERELVGMLSDRDVRALAGDNDAVLLTMSSDVVSVDTEAEIEEVVDLMLENKIGAVPVVDADGILVGIISYVDVLREARFDAPPRAARAMHADA